MPPKGEPLTAKEVALLEAWIDQGFAWEDGFTFKGADYVAPLQAAPADPAAGPRRAATIPIDRIVDAYFAQHKVSPPAPLDDAAFMRRVYLDVIGLLPAPEEVDAFLKDTAADKRARLDPPTAGRQARLRRALADLLERPAAQRLRRHRLHRRRPQADHRLALPLAAGQQALRPVRPRADQPDAGVGGVHQGHQVARQRQRQPGAGDAVLAERLAGVLRHQHEVRLVPRQLHRHAGSWTTPTAWRPSSPTGRWRSTAATSRPASKASAAFLCARAGRRSTRRSRRRSGWSSWPGW